MPEANRIDSADHDLIQPQVERLVIPYGAPMDSQAVSTFFEQVTGDLSQLARQGNAGVRALNEAWRVLSLEGESARQRSIALEAQIKSDRRVRGLQGHRLTHWVDFHNGRDITWVTGAPISRRASVSTLYGQATIPLNGIESRLYTQKLLAEGVVTPNTLMVSTTGVFDKGEGDGATDYESGADIEETDPLNLANGNNHQYWRRRAIFDLDSDVSEVECEVTITVPDSANLYANTIYAHPYPLANVDLAGLWISPDLSGSFVEVPSFDEVDNANHSRWFFPAQKVAQMKARLRQRTWFEQNGRRVFEYGLQELGLQLAEWDQTYDADATSYADNHAFVAKITAEDGFLFRYLYGVYSSPDWTLESSDNRHVHLAIALDKAGDQVIWESDVNGAPQALSTPVDLGAVRTLYVIVTLNWCESVGSGSPFLAGCPPFLNGIGLDVTYLRSA